MEFIVDGLTGTRFGDYGYSLTEPLTSAQAAKVLSRMRKGGAG